MHLHLYSFCGDCSTKAWHVNTENLVSMPMSREQVEAYLAHQTAPEDHPDHDKWGFGLVEVERIEHSSLEGRVRYDNDDLVRWDVCEGPCPQPDMSGSWKHLDTHPYVAIERPVHFTEASELLGPQAGKQEG